MAGEKFSPWGKKVGVFEGQQQLDFIKMTNSSDLWSRGRILCPGKGRPCLQGKTHLQSYDFSLVLKRSQIMMQAEASHI